MDLPRTGLIFEVLICGACHFTGVPRSKDNAPPWDPTVGLCIGAYGGTRGGDVFL